LSAPILIYGAGGADANLFYATRFLTPDPYIFLEQGGRTAVVVGDLEVGRAREQATVDRVVSQSEVEARLRERGIGKPGPVDVILALLGRTRRVSVPASFPVGLADQLRSRNVCVEPRAGVFWASRAVKRPDEVRAIEASQRAVEEAVEEAVEVLRRSKVRSGRLMYKGEALTSENLRRIIDRALLERDCAARDTIVACGDQGCDPHQRGDGPLRANRTIIMDVFPQSNRTRYFADMTRTVVKGQASPQVKRIFRAVQEAQAFGISRVRAGADGAVIHREVQDFFKNAGWRTGPVNGKMEGYFHGTGHGVGIDIHEAPWVTPRGGTLEAGAVVTVEPGLYYWGVGGVRLEDMVLVTKTGCRNLTRFPIFLEV